MKHAKHTPGPWMSEETNDSTFIVDSDSRVIGLCDRSDAFTEQEHVANARLISAAPDMFHALESLIESLEYHNLGKNLVALSWAKDAIAKARGES